MPELRLTDPNGYTVTVTTVPDEDVAQAATHLLTTVAPAHAAENADFGYDARYYNIG